MNAALDTADVERAIAAALGAPVCVAIAYLDTVAGAADEHALGRVALARALAAAGRGDEPVTRWPCPFASVSHSRGLAVAVALPRAHAVRGLGVDVELDRPVRPGLAGVFCDARERAWLEAQPACGRDAAVLQLWTAKEALYKADAAQGDAIVAEYAVEVPSLSRGGRGHGRSARLVSLRIGDASLSVALEPEPAPLSEQRQDDHVAATW